MAQSCPTGLSEEKRIQSQLNDMAAQMPLHILDEYLETLRSEFRELFERVQRLQLAEVEQEILFQQADSDSSRRTELEALRKELRELPVHIRRVERAIEARHRRIVNQESEWFRGANTLERSAPVQREKTRNPMAMIRSEYKGMKLADIAAKILSAEPTPLTTTQLAQRVYCTLSNVEFERARDSLSAELRLGAKSSNPRWRKCGRFAYCGLHIQQEVSM